MKTLTLGFICFSAWAFGQQQMRNLDWSTKDSVAVKNVNSIIDYSKKSFSYKNVSSEIKNGSEVNKNLNQLLVNTINFNTVVNGQHVSPVEAGTFTKPRINAIDRAGRMLMSIPVYKSK